MMKNKDYISNEYPRSCRFCEKGRPSFDGSAVLCPRRGILSPDDCCKKYVYDPLKRKPPVASPKTSGLSPEDFTL